MAQTIGSVACTFVRGGGRSWHERVNVWQRPGISGYGSQLMGQGDADFAFLGIIYGIDAGVATWIDDMNALQGTTVTIEDDFARTWTNCLIQRVEAPIRSTAIGTSWQVRAEMLVRGVFV